MVLRERYVNRILRMAAGVESDKHSVLSRKSFSGRRLLLCQRDSRSPLCHKDKFS